jgi:hypothetical protein
MCAQHASREAPTGIVANVKCKLLLPHTDPFSSIIATVSGHQHERANLSLYILAEKCKTLFAVFLADISFFPTNQANLFSTSPYVHTSRAK